MTSVLQDFIISLHRDVQVMCFIKMQMNIVIVYHPFLLSKRSGFVQ